MRLESPEDFETMHFTLRNVSVYRVKAGGHFDLVSVDGESCGTAYSLSVERGKIESTQIGGANY